MVGYNRKIYLFKTKSDYCRRISSLCGRIKLMDFKRHWQFIFYTEMLERYKLELSDKEYVHFVSYQHFHKPNIKITAPDQPCA